MADTTLATTSGGDKKPLMEYPTAKVLTNACKISVKYKKPIDFYFYQDSLKGKVFIMDEAGDSIIYKNEEENSSAIVKLFECDNCYITITENTVYILSKNVKKRK